MSEEKWDQRQLCSDGGCIGVIGPDGTCKTCGRVAPNWGEERKRGLVEPDDDRGDADEADAEDPVDAADSNPLKAAAVVALKPRGAWNERRLCSDGSCIGVIGPDGTCKLCGKAGPEDDGDDDDLADDDPDDLATAGDDDDDEDDYDDEQDDEYEDEDDDKHADDAAAKPEATATTPEVPATPELAIPMPAPSIEEDLEKPRALCPDGACVGVIGPDGKCKVCGKASA